MASPLLILDLGTSQIKALVAKKEGEDYKILLSLIKPSQGIKSGIINDHELLRKRLEELLSEINRTNKKMDFSEATTGIGSCYLEVKNSKGVAVISKSNQEIEEEDVNRAIQAAEAVALPLNRILVQSVIQGFKIDEKEKVKDPVGLKGIKLEAEILLIDVFSPVMKSIDRLEEYLGINFNHRFVLPLAGSEVVLSEKDKDLGVMTIDFGAGTTSICVYENNELVDLKVFPLGGNYITNDIAVGLRTYVDIAEEIKINEGGAYAKKISKTEIIDGKRYDPDLEEKISKKFVAEIIEARLCEILDLITEELKQINRFCKLPAGVIIYGGGAKLPYLVDLIKDKLKLAVRIGEIDNEWYQENKQIEFIPAIGLLHLRKQLEEEKSFYNQSNFFKKILKPFLRMFNI
ncbi:MAG: cell division protein FtsA [Candidatus Paceibacterota bacterium]